MKYSRKPARRAITSALTLIALLNLSMPTDNLRQPLSPPAAPPTNSKAAVSYARALSHQQARARASEAYGKLPLRFEANAGQADGQVKFLSRGSGYDLFLTPTEAILAM